MKVFDVKHEDREMRVIIPDTGDRQENEYLELAEREKTLDQLKKKPKREKSKLSKQDQVEAIKELKTFKERRRRNTILRYFSGDYTS